MYHAIWCLEERELLSTHLPIHTADKVYMRWIIFTEKTFEQTSWTSYPYRTESGVSQNLRPLRAARTMWVYFTLSQQSTLKIQNSGYWRFFGKTDGRRKFELGIPQSRGAPYIRGASYIRDKTVSKVSKHLLVHTREKPYSVMPISGNSFQ